jgi:hypothetical protein
MKDGQTVVLSPRKLFGQQTNYLFLQLRRRGVRRMVLGGMLANSRAESHRRDLLENEFEVYVRWLLCQNEPVECADKERLK